MLFAASPGWSPVEGEKAAAIGLVVHLIIAGTVQIAQRERIANCPTSLTKK